MSKILIVKLMLCISDLQYKIEVESAKKGRHIAFPLAMEVGQQSIAIESVVKIYLLFKHGTKLPSIVIGATQS